MTGAPTTPARPASTVPITQAHRDVTRSSTPRSPASSGRSTTARICSPSGVRRIRNHSAHGDARRPRRTRRAGWSRAATSTRQLPVSRGDGPMPGGQRTPGLRVGDVPVERVDAASRRSKRVSAGSATSRPTVAMILAASVALASGRNTATLSSSPSSGQNTRIVTTARRHDRPAQAGVELVVQERRGERDGAVGEVEDAGRRVRQRQPGGDQRVDRPGDRPADHEVEELLHVPAPPLGPSGAPEKHSGIRNIRIVTTASGTAPGCRPGRRARQGPARRGAVNLTSG